MRSLQEFSGKSIRFLCTDIDDTLTQNGRLTAEAFAALWHLDQAGIQVVPVTGRPAGWCELIARQWPVAGVIGENGAFYFRYHNQKMQRYFAVDEGTRAQHQSQLAKIENEILKKVPGSAIASDQFCRISDLAIDYCEDVPALPEKSVQEIVRIFQNHGATAKVSSIHVNGWFGDFDKLSTCLEFFQREFSMDESAVKKHCAFSGDSPNDEPMFRFFETSFGVANVSKFAKRMKALPGYISPSEGGSGFAEIAACLLQTQEG